MIADDEREAQRERPTGRPAGFQRWRDLAFLHWPVDAGAVAALLPPGLEVDTWEGEAWIGVVPFAMRDVSPWWSPSVPGISNFLELNVRTYVHRGGRAPGVWFFSLDAAKAIAVLLARTGWDLPYHFATMDLEKEGHTVRYASERRFPGPTPATLALEYTIGDPLGESRPGTFEYFLAERYVLYAQGKLGLRVGRVHHAPYPLHAARVRRIEQSVVTAAGLPPLDGLPHALYAPGVDVDVFALEPLG